MAYLLLMLVLAGLGLRRLAADAHDREPAKDARDRPGRRSGFLATARPGRTSPARSGSTRLARRRRAPRAPEKPSATTAARSSNASRVSGLSRSRLISAPSSRCGSNGTCRTARHRRAKWSTTFFKSTLPERGRTALMTAIELRTMSWWPCASSQSRVAAALRAPSTDPELITTSTSALVEHRRHRRVQHAGAAVGEHHAVEPLEHFQGAGVVLGAERLRHRRVAL